MMIRNIIKEIYYHKIKKMSHMEYRIFHLKRVGMNIGDDCWIFSDDLETNESYLVTIGDGVMISPKVTMLTHDASASYYLTDASDLFGKVQIGNKCFIGYGAIILPGVTIADNCIIGAGSVVTKSFNSPGSVIAGNPARIVCTIDQLKEKNQKYSLNTWNQINKKDYLLNHVDRFLKK